MAPRVEIVNIAGSKAIDDPEYRYKMPLVYGKIEGRGNGIKTVIPNITDVATSLHRSPGEVNKFFGCELGAQTSYAPETDRAVVNGAHNDATLRAFMKRYIDVFVLCPACGLPETQYKIKDKHIYHRCKACGAKEEVDMSHKLCTYILAQDKKAKKEKSKEKKQKGSDDDTKKKKKKKDKEKEKEIDENADKKKKKKDKHKSKKKKSTSPTGSKDENYAEDKKVADFDDLSCDDVSAMEIAVQATKNFLARNPHASAKDIIEVVLNEQMASALKSHDKVHIFAQAALTSDFFKLKLISKYAPVFSQLTNDNPIMLRHLISALEGICIDNPKHFPVMLKQMYDEDILEEDVILLWASEGRGEYTLEKVDEEMRVLLRSQAEPVVVWLQDDESDEDDD